MLTGSMAYQILEDTAPSSIPRIIALLTQHPEFESHWTSLLEEAAGDERRRAQLLFMLAARWADDIRGNAKFHRALWHFADIPYVKPGSPDTVTGRPPQTTNLLTGYASARATLTDPDAQDSDKAVALCWMFHLIGDSHQPLHAASMFSEKFPDGDRGGNLQFIRVTESARPINLHAYWDGAVIGSTRPQAVRNEGVRLLKRLVAPNTTKITERNPEVWIQESASDAVQVAYANGTLVTSQSMSQAPVLPEAYRIKALEVSEKRIVLAAYRLAHVLGELFQ
jgi:hypothetical protein